MSAPCAIVTGASSGIGRACAERLAGRGMRVFGFSRSSPGTDAAIEHVATDVTDDVAVRAGVDRVLRETARIDLLLNCAGYGLAGAVADTSIAEAQCQFDVNFFGALRLCRAVVPVMQRQRTGLIVNMSSLGGLFGLPFQGIYSATKFALEGLTDALRHEMRPFGVDVVSIEPGDVRTEITRRRVRAQASAAPSAHGEQFRAAMAVIERDESRGVEPAAVADVVERVWLSGSRRPRYACGHPSQKIAARGKSWLPASVFEALIGDHYEGERVVEDASSDPHRGTGAK